MKPAVALLAALFLVITLGPQPFSGPDESDLPIYAGYADQMFDGRLPYRDFEFEYPPLTAPVLALGGFAGVEERPYRFGFAALMFLIACAVVWLIGAIAARTGGDRRMALVAGAVAVGLCGSLVRSRFDLVPTALMLGALLLLCIERPRAAFAVLGLGVMTKGFPLVVAPIALVWLVARGKRREAAHGAAILAATLLLIGGGAWAFSPDGFEDSLRYHLDRPAQVEGSPAVVLTALEAVGAGEAVSERSFKSAGVRHPQSGLVLALFTGLFAATVAVLAGAMTLRPPPDQRDLVLASLAAVAAFAVFGKVFSPQFMIWIAPLAALALAWGMYPLAATLVVAQVLTLYEFPRLYPNLEDNDHYAVAVVGLRNAVMVAALALALRALVNPARAAAGSKWPGRLRRPRPAPR